MQKNNIINIVNFIRAIDPRDASLDLIRPVKEQVRLGKQYHFPQTFLLQYDALIRPEFTSLLLNNMDETTEFGVWIEIVQPLVESLGMKWKGRPGFAWDWHVNAGFLMGYTQDERRMLIDRIMEEFKKVFGCYPKSAGSWLLDSFSMSYMSEKYKMSAFSICKEQYGTDGYTLWGGFYNQGYYPCKKNMLHPAQTKKEQISTPVFRMLGIDPIYQYESGIDENGNYLPCQKVCSLEPSWECGKNPDWVDWYFRNSFESESLAFAYAQVGQENSFGWETMCDGLKMQYEKLYNLSKEKKITIESLSQTGEWFKNNFDITPAVAMTFLDDWKNDGRKSVWYNCRFYRANLAARGKKVYFRDIQLFDENYTETYYKDTAKSNNAVYDTLPVVDGFLWSGGGIFSGLYFEDKYGCSDAFSIEKTVKKSENSLEIYIDFKGFPVKCLFAENGIKISSQAEYRLAIKYSSIKNTAITNVQENCVFYWHNGVKYKMQANGGSFKTCQNEIILTPDSSEVQISFECFN